MNEHKIGALVVMDGGQVVGMFTERDVLRRIVGDGRNPAATKVGQVMTSNVICCDVNDDLDDVATLMRTRRIRHVPVCNGDGKLMGMVSIGDLNAMHTSTQEATIHFLNEYIYGRA
jgi:CBS domain-containing protein